MGRLQGKWREGDSREETGEKRLKWHRNMALAAAIHEYAGLVGSGHGWGRSHALFWSAETGFLQDGWGNMVVVGIRLPNGLNDAKFPLLITLNVNIRQGSPTFSNLRAASLVRSRTKCN